MDPYSRMIDIIREEGAVFNGYPLEVADVISSAPVQIKYNDTTITMGIWIPAEMSRIPDPSGISTQESELKAYLTTVYRTLKLSPGDKVFVQRVKDKFYILGKAVKV